jgi:uncharacterized membrane protein
VNAPAVTIALLAQPTQNRLNSVMAFVPRSSSADERERFTRRLEAFSDLVFGFSLSLLAIRLDVPANVHDIFALTRVIPFVVTFAIICGMWLEHYRIFRYHFVAHPFEIAANFVFLFGLAVLPFAVQTFIRFPAESVSVALYFGDFALVLASLSILRWRGLLQRRDDLDEQERLRDWKRLLAQCAVAFIMVVMVALLSARLIAVQDLVDYVAPAILVFVLVLRLSVRRLPEFLRHRSGR